MFTGNANGRQTGGGKRNRIKAVVKDTFDVALIKGVNTLPWTSRKALLDAMIQSIGVQNVFCEVGNRLSVTSVNVKGEYGTFTGSMDDIYLLGRYMQERTYAPELIALLREFFTARGGGTFIDIGANIGLTLAPIANIPNVSSHGFEPAPKNFAYLTHNIATNCQNAKVSLWQLALFDKKSTLRFALSKVNSGDHRIQLNQSGGVFDDQNWEKIDVPTDRLDDLAIEIKQPLAIKMDTQGAEPNIFAGGKRILSVASVIAFEFWPYGMGLLGGDIIKWIEFLAGMFKEGSIVDGDGVKAMNWKSIDEICSELKRLWSNPNISTNRYRYFDVIVRKD